MRKKKLPPAELQILLVYYVECPFCLYDNVLEHFSLGGRSKGRVRCGVCKRKLRWELRHGEPSKLEQEDIEAAKLDFKTADLL